MIRILALISIVAGIHFSLFAEPHIGLVDHYEILFNEAKLVDKKIRWQPLYNSRELIKNKPDLHFEAMAEALRTNNTLEVLNIPAQNFTEEQAKFFLEPLKINTTLVELGTGLQSIAENSKIKPELKEKLIAELKKNELIKKVREDKVFWEQMKPFLTQLGQKDINSALTLLPKEVILSIIQMAMKVRAQEK